MATPISQAWITKALLATLSLLAMGAAAASAKDVRASTAAVSCPHVSKQLAKGKFLIASRGLLDPNFRRTVVLLADYGPNGASGLVVNRPSRSTLSELLPGEEFLRPRNDTIYIGGPVAQDRLLLLIRAPEKPAESHVVFDDVYISGSASTLRALAADGKDAVFRPYMGYAGWAPGQLENEVERGDWSVLPAEADAIFEEPSTSLWRKWIERSAGEWAFAIPVP